MNNDIEFLEDSVHKLADAIRKLRAVRMVSERQGTAFEVIETAEELGKAIAQVLPEIERQAVIDAQMNNGTPEEMAKVASL